MPRSSKDIAGAGRNMLLVAKSGAGKTHMLGTAADHEKLYIISVEGGLSSIADKTFDYDECNTWAEVEAKVEWFFKNYKALGYTALGLDSLDRAQRYLIQSMLDADKTHKLSYDRFNEMLGKLRKMLDILNKAEGYSFCFLSGQGSTAIISVTPATGDYLVVDGVRGTAATNYASAGAAGDKICMFAANADDWYVTSEVGTWSE